MAGPYFKEWRKKRGYTQEQVLDRLAALDDPLVPQTGASLSRLENHRQTYTQRSLEALASVYEIEPHELLGHNPEKEGEVIDLVRVLNERQRRQAMALLKALKEAN